MTDKRLIEETFPLRQTSLDSVHEKNVRHGHISTLHIWPARRPLAAARAALIAALLPDPGDEAAREALVRRIGGTIDVKRDKKGKPKQVTEGGILHWGNEASPEVARFRDEIRQAYGNEAPKVLDMFAGGGAIPLEAMRLGCDVTAIDYNPVAWLLLKCTLDYPHRLVGKQWPLPTQGIGEPGLTPTQETLTLEGTQRSLGEVRVAKTGGLADHVRYWGDWVLARARADLKDLYPTLPLDPSRPAGSDNPECPTVAYLWARTVPHPDPQKNGLRVPLLKTLWLCKKAADESVDEDDEYGRRRQREKKRALRIVYSAAANRYDYEVFTPASDDEVGPGTMQGNGVICPPTSEEEQGAFIPTSRLQALAQEGKMGAVCTAVVVGIPPSNPNSKQPPRKEYRAPTQAEQEAAERAAELLPVLANELPHGLPNEPIDPASTRSISCHYYGLNTYAKLFSPRQLLAVGTFAKHTRAAKTAICALYDKDILSEVVTAYLAIATDRLAHYGSSLTHWHKSAEKISTPVDAFPMNWDFTEVMPLSELTGGYSGSIEWITKFIDHATLAANAANVRVLNRSSTHDLEEEQYDAIVTDPPYYQAKSYADLSDFFYVWLRRIIGDEYGQAFTDPLTPKERELVQHVREDKKREVEKLKYENGMAQAFKSACNALKDDGRMVIVFAHKDPNAWETLVSAMIRAGFVVTASWPIDTEMANRSNALGNASLASSVWLVCRKRPKNAGRGNLATVRAQMRRRIEERLHYFWDNLKHDIKGADFVWSAIGPGLEAYSAYDSVVSLSGQSFEVKDFIAEVRRITTDLALGRVLKGGNTEGLDEWTRYALMHLQNFGLEGAPVGECILLAGAYNLKIDMLTGPRGFLGKAKKKKGSIAEEDSGDASDSSGGSGSELRLLRWDERKRDDLGEPHPTLGLPYIDRLHRLLREWASGDTRRADAYIQQQGLGQNELFWRVAQAFAEMLPVGSPDKSRIETLISRGKDMPAASITLPAPIAKPTTGTFDF